MSLRCLPSLPLQPPTEVNQCLCMRAGGAPCRLCHRNHDNDSRSNVFGSNQTMSTSMPPQQPSQDKRTASQGGGEETEEELMSLSPSAADQSKLPMTMQNPLPTTTASYHWTHFLLSPLFHLQLSGGGWRNNLFWLY